MAGRVAIVGSSLGALVAAERLGALGHDVWIFARRDQAGGRHRGIVMGEDAFDLTPAELLLDPTAIDEGDGEPAAHTLISEWAATLALPLAPAPRRRLVLADGTTIDDVVLDGSPPDGIAGLPQPIREVIARDLRRLPPTPPASGTSLRDVVLARHGETLVEALLDPYLRAVTGLPSAQLGPDVGAAGIALHDPATLRALLMGQPVAPVARAPRTLGPGPLRAVVDHLLVRLDRMPRVRWVEGVLERIERPHAGVVVRLADATYAFEAAIAAASPQRLLPLLGARELMPRADSAPGTQCFAVVTDAEPVQATLVGIDPGLPVRTLVHSRDGGRGVAVTLDWGARAMGDDAALAALTADALVRLGIARDPGGVRLLHVRRALDAQVLSTVATREATTVAQATLQQLAPGLERVGAARHGGLGTLTDELVDALRAAVRVAERLAPRPGRVRVAEAGGVRPLAADARTRPSLTLLLTDVGRRRRDIDRAIHGVLAQDVDDLELLLAVEGDAGPAHASVESFTRAHAGRSRIGVVAARDADAALAAAGQEARGRALAVLPASLALLPGALAAALAVLDAPPGAELVVGARLELDGDASGASHDAARPGARPGGALVVLRRALWDRIGGWPTGGGDAARLFADRLGAEGIQARVLAVPVVVALPGVRAAARDQAA